MKRPALFVLLLFAAAACGGGESTGGGQPAVSRDGKWIAFSGGGIRVVGPGAAATRITDPGEEIDAFPEWSPDGSKLVFARAGKGQFDPWRLYVVGRDGSGLRQLTAGDGPLGERAPSWSPDGETIAFERFGLEGSVHAIDVDGTGERLLLRDAGEPAWSPDGSMLVFVRGLGKALAILDLRTKRIEPVLKSKFGTAASPAWSPDGTQIAFEDTPDGFPEIFVVNVDGTGLRRLTTHPEVDSSPAWTPAGRIVFVSSRTGTERLYVMNGDGTGVRRRLLD